MVNNESINGNVYCAIYSVQAGDKYYVVFVLYAHYSATVEVCDATRMPYAPKPES